MRSDLNHFSHKIPDHTEWKRNNTPRQPHEKPHHPQNRGDDGND